MQLMTIDELLTLRANGKARQRAGFAWVTTLAEYDRERASIDHYLKSGQLAVGEDGELFKTEVAE